MVVVLQAGFVSLLFPQIEVVPKVNAILIRAMIKHSIHMDAHFCWDHCFCAISDTERCFASRGSGGGALGPLDLEKFFGSCFFPVIKFGLEHVDNRSFGNFDLSVCLRVSW